MGFGHAILAVVWATDVAQGHHGKAHPLSAMALKSRVAVYVSLCNLC